MTDLGCRDGIKIRRWLHRAERWRHIGRHRIRVMKKPDGSKVNWIIKKKREGNMTTVQIAESTNVSAILGKTVPAHIHVMEWRIS